MILYYPCGATEAMGPTGVLPGSQYFQADPNEQPTVGKTLGASLQLHQRLLTLPPNQGTAVLVHFHTWSVSVLCLFVPFFCVDLFLHRLLQASWYETLARD
jgi:hypothetical protein